MFANISAYTEIATAFLPCININLRYTYVLIKRCFKQWLLLAINIFSDDVVVMTY